MEIEVFRREISEKYNVKKGSFRNNRIVCQFVIHASNYVMQKHIKFEILRYIANEDAYKFLGRLLHVPLM